MQRLDGQLVLSPTDLTHHQECAHLSRLDLGVAAGEWPAPDAEVSEELQLVFDRGLEHEKRYLEELRSAGKSIVEIETVFDPDGRRRAEEQTVAAMRSGVDVVYQGTFFDGAWGGQADFLLKVPGTSDFGDWLYEIADTKLARKLKVAALLQMATYAERLTVLQGVEPPRIHVVTGDGVSRMWRLVDVAAYARRARTRLETFVAAPPATGPSPIGYCEQCRWAEKCNTDLRAADDLGLVAFMRGDHRDALFASGITTLAALAQATPEQLAESGIGVDARTRLQQQAAEQLKERTTGQISRLLLDPQPGLGLLRLPPPSPGDLYLDFEGDPWFEDGKGIEYLAGLGNTTGAFTPLWAHDREAEKRMVVDLIDRLVAAAQADPGMHVYHYAPYEVTALKKLTGGYGVREAELDQLLREERFVDLYPVVRQSMRISKESYSIKKVEEFYGRSHEGAVASGMASVLMYEHWLVDRDQQQLDDIESYNKDDVDSTRELHEWLEQQRALLEEQDGPQPRPAPVTEQAPEAPATEAIAAELELVQRLHDAGHPLLGDLVQWHRREDRPVWWEVFHLTSLDREALIRHSTALGGLSDPIDRGAEKKSRLYEYTFPEQDTRLSAGDDVRDAETAQSVGSIFELDAAGGRVVLKTTAAEPPRPRGLGPSGPLNTKSLREAIAATGEDVLAGRDCLGHALIQRRVPAGTELRDGESTTQAIVRLGLALDGEVLAIQGPPGSGKTTAAAVLIRELLDAGKKVGVTATSHAVIGNLLKAVGRPAMQKCTAEQHCGSDDVVGSDNNTVVDQRAAVRRREPGRRDGVVLDAGGRGAGRRRAGRRRGRAVLAGQRRRGGAGCAVDGAARRPPAAGPAEPGGAPGRLRRLGAGAPARGARDHAAGPRCLPRPLVPDAPRPDRVRLRPRLRGPAPVGGRSGGRRRPRGAGNCRAAGSGCTRCGTSSGLRTGARRRRRSSRGCGTRSRARPGPTTSGTRRGSAPTRCWSSRRTTRRWR